MHLSKKKKKTTKKNKGNCLVTLELNANTENIVEDE